MDAVVVDYDFTVDSKNCTIVGLQGKIIESVCGNSYESFKLKSVFLLATELLQVKGTRRPRCCANSLLDIVRAGEIAIENRVGEPRLADMIGDGFQVRPTQESRAIHDAATPGGCNDDEVENGLLMLCHWNFER